jgi:hypothetical protein
MRELLFGPAGFVAVVLVYCANRLLALACGRRPL